MFFSCFGPLGGFVCCHDQAPSSSCTARARPAVQVGSGQRIQEGARPPACHWLLTAGGGLSVVPAVSQLRFVFTLSADVTWDSLLEQREVGIRFTLPAPPLKEETTGHRCKDPRPLSRAHAAHFRTPGFIPLAHLSVLVQIPPGFNSCNVIDFGLRKGNLPPCALCS